MWSCERLCGPFGLSLSKPLALIGVRAFVEGGGRESPRRARYLFFASPKKSTQKKGAPQSATPALRYGADLRRGGCGVRRGTRCALRAPLGQPRRARSRSMGAATPMPPRRRRSQQGGPNSLAATRAIAVPGPAFAARGACAREDGAERSNGPNGCLLGSLLRVPRSAGQGVRACAVGHTHFVH